MCAFFFSNFLFHGGISWTNLAVRTNSADVVWWGKGAISGKEKHNKISNLSSLSHLCFIIQLARCCAHRVSYVKLTKQFISSHQGFFFIINIFVTVLLQHLGFKDNFKGILKETSSDNQGGKQLLLEANFPFLQIFHLLQLLMSLSSGLCRSLSSVPTLKL